MDLVCGSLLMKSRRVYKIIFIITWAMDRGQLLEG